MAGFIDTLAGGGGLLIIPALLLAQVPPVQAISTNKLQGSFGTLTSAVTMICKGKVSMTRIKRPFAFAFFGSITGALTIQYLPDGLVRVIIPTVLFVIAGYFLFSRINEEGQKEQKVSDGTFDCLVSPGIGFYDGAFGPGAGSFFTLSAVALLGKNLVDATASAKVLNFASNLAALITFIIGGKVLWIVGGVMIAGTMVGAFLGSLAVINIGAKIIRPTIVFMSLSMLAVYCWKQFF